MPFEIHNKVAIVTGGASGIGFNYVKELLRNGLKVMLLGFICLPLNVCLIFVGSYHSRYKQNGWQWGIGKN